MERVLDKDNPADRKFGLLSCEHCFCISCIRGWRKNAEADLDSAARACPVCRVSSWFVTPSTTWPQTEVRTCCVMILRSLCLSWRNCTGAADGTAGEVRCDRQVVVAGHLLKGNAIKVCHAWFDDHPACRRRRLASSARTKSTWRECPVATLTKAGAPVHSALHVSTGMSCQMAHWRTKTRCSCAWPRTLMASTSLSSL